MELQTAGIFKDLDLGRGVLRRLSLNGKQQWPRDGIAFLGDPERLKDGFPELFCEPQDGDALGEGAACDEELLELIRGADRFGGRGWLLGRSRLGHRFRRAEACPAGKQAEDDGGGMAHGQEPLDSPSQREVRLCSR